MIKSIIFMLVVLVLAIAYWLISPLWTVKHIDDASPTTQIVTTEIATGQTTPASMSGTFTNGVHDVTGMARITASNTGEILRFENFKTLNGPDLHIYLATDKTAKDYMDVGIIKGTEGNINYNVPAGVDLKKYNHVLVWCKTFSVLFGEAILK
jgi:hypothetical protein